MAGCLILALISPGVARAQEDPQASTASLALPGLAGAAVGFLGGGLLGMGIERSFLPVTGDDPGLRGALIGSGLGSALLAPVAVHAANEGEGSLKVAMLASVGAMGASYAALYVASKALPKSVYPYVLLPTLFVVTPAGEVAASISVLRATD